MAEIAGVVDHDVGCRQALFPGGLRGDAGAGIAGGVAALDESGHPHVVGGVDHDNEVVGALHVQLHQQRHIVNEHCLRGQSGDQCSGARGDSGMSDAVEGLSRIRVGEDDVGQGLPVQAAVAVQDARAERLDEGLQAFGAGLDHLAGDGIGVDDVGAKVREQPGDCGLSGADTAGETDASHADEVSGALALSRPRTDDGGVDGKDRGAPVGRRVVLGLIGLAGVGVVLGSKANSALTALSANDPTGLTGFIPGGGRFRFYSVVAGVPQTSERDYRLAVNGLVGAPREFTFADLQAMPQTDLMLDVQCVTGWRVPQVAWTGVRLSDVLDEVGVADGAAAVSFGCSDGVYTESLTLEQARRDDVLIALTMQGEPVTHDHGGPVRLYVGPMYFYKSAKWLNRITITDEVVPGYWEQRGYDTDAWVGSSNGRDDLPI